MKHINYKCIIMHAALSSFTCIGKAFTLKGAVIHSCILDLPADKFVLQENPQSHQRSHRTTETYCRESTVGFESEGQ